MNQWITPLGQPAVNASLCRAEVRFDVRHPDSTMTISAMGTKFTPDGQRPKESLL